MMRLLKMIAVILTAFSTVFAGKGTDAAFSAGNIKTILIKQVEDIWQEVIPETGENAEAEGAAGKEGCEKETGKVTDPAGETAHADEETKCDGPVAAGADKTDPEKYTDGEKAAAETTKSEEEAVHVHDWQVRTEGIWHDEVTEEVWVVDQEAYEETVTEEVPVYEEVRICVASCRGCGMTFSGEDYSTMIDECHSHIISEHGNACGYGLEKSYTEMRQTGTKTETYTVSHEEEGHFETVVISEGYEETVAAGYYCTGCTSIR